VFQALYTTHTVLAITLSPANHNKQKRRRIPSHANSAYTNKIWHHTQGRTPITCQLTGTVRGPARRPHFFLAIISVTVQLWTYVFWVISVYFNIRNTLPNSGTFLLGHPVYYKTSFRVICGNLRKKSHAAVREYCVITSYRAITSCGGVHDSIYGLVPLTSLSKYWTSSSSIAGDVMARRRKQRDSKMAHSCVIAATEWHWH
jgi:hypothetical protein